MKKNQKIKTISYLCFLLLLPLVVLSFFTFPSSDDYAMFFLMTERGANAWEVVGHLYRTWGGRYSTLAGALLSGLVVQHLWLYRLLLLVSMVLLFGSVRWFWSQVLVFRGRSIYLVSLVFLVVWIQLVPGIADTFYWYSGMVVYTWPLIFFFFAMGALLKNSTHTGWKLLTGFSVFCMAGFNEMAAAMAAMLSLLLIANDIRHRCLKKHLGLHLFVLAGLLFLLLSPGNQERISLFAGSGNLLISLKISLLSLLKLNGILVQNVSFWLIVLVLLPVMRPQTFHPRLSGVLQLHPLTVFLAGEFFLLLMFWIPSWSMGINPPLRVYNFLVPFGLLWMLWLVVSIHSHLPEKTRSMFPVFRGGALNYGLMVIFLSLMLSFVKIPGGEIVFGGNIPRAYYDLFVHAGDHNHEMKSREELISKERSKGSTEIVVPRLTTPPKTIHFLDMTTDADHWINALYARHYGVERIRTKEGAQR